MRAQLVHIFLFTPVRLCEEISYSEALLKIKMFNNAFKCIFSCDEKINTI